MIELIDGGVKLSWWHCVLHCSHSFRATLHLVRLVGVVASKLNGPVRAHDEFGWRLIMVAHNTYFVLSGFRDGGNSILLP